MVFWISAAIFFFDAIEFLIFGDGREQAWNNLANIGQYPDGASAEKGGVVNVSVNPLDMVKREQLCEPSNAFSTTVHQGNNDNFGIEMRERTKSPAKSQD